jgi:hypothetical protein
MANTVAISLVGGAAGAPYHLVCEFPSAAGFTPPIEDGALVLWTCPGTGSLPNGVTIPGNFSGSLGRALTLPTATATFTVNKIPAGSTTPTAFGTVVISTAGAFTFATTSGLPETFAAGDGLTMVAPATADTTLANVEITLAGTR